METRHVWRVSYIFWPHASFIYKLNSNNNNYEERRRKNPVSPSKIKNNDVPWKYTSYKFNGQFF